jgi:DNA-binding transcriptional ArsR family regulator
MATALATPQAATPLPRARPGTSRAKLSNHLTCLRDCGLVTATAEGRHVRYDLADPTLADALRLLTSLNLPGTCDR